MILDFICPGDLLIVVKLDRLGRNTRDVLNLVHELEEKGASLRVLEPAIDTGGPMGRMVLTALGMVAEMELGFLRDRQRAGIDAAKAKGVYQGRLCHVRPRTHRSLRASHRGSGGAVIFHPLDDRNAGRPVVDHIERSREGGTSRRSGSSRSNPSQLWR